MNTTCKAASTMWLSLLLLFLLIVPLSADSDSEGVNEPPLIPKTNTSITIDGAIIEPEWQKAQSFELPYEVNPGENTEAPVRTELLMFYNKTHLYVAFRAYDPQPDRIRARYRDRDSAFQDDFVGIVVDTFNDERNGFEFSVNALGVQMDQTVSRGSDKDRSWNAIWSSAGQLTDFGYSVEMAIPFTQIRFQAGEDIQTWGLDAIRVYPREDRTLIALNQRDRNVTGYLNQLRKIRGFAGISRGENIEIVPTITAQRTDSRADFPDGDLEEESSKGDFGITGRWGITPNITLNGTFNPDFSQIEADSVRLDINQTFAIFFPETRPFFLDGQNYFDLQRFNMVHTRTISNPDYAVKTTGKVGRHQFGMFTAQDTVTPLILPGATGSDSAGFGFDSLATVGRYSMDFGENSTMGAMLTDRRGSGYSSTAVSFDTRYRPTDTDTIAVAFSGSTTTYNDEAMDEFGLADPDAEGYALGAYYGHRQRNWFFDSSYTDISEGFRADLGFMPQVNFRRTIVGGGREWWGEEGDFFRRLTLSGDVDYTDDQDGNLIEQEAEIYLRGRGPKRSFFMVGGGVRERVFEGVSFDQSYYTAGFEFWPNGDMFAGSWLNWGDHIDFANVRAAERFNLDIFGSYNLGRRIYLTLNYDFSVLDVAGGRLFTTNVPQVRAVYQFSNRLFLRSIFQFVHIRRNTDLYEDDDVEPLTEDLATQILLSYKINPQTVFYAGYSDQYEGTELYSLTQSSRTFFVKIGYAWLK